MSDPRGGTSTLATSGGLPLTVAQPVGEPRGAVIVVQEAFGVTEHIADVAARAAAAGYLAVAPHLYHRSGDPVFGYDDYASVGSVIGKLTAETITEDIDATIGYLDDAGFSAGQIGIVGFCMGGSVTLYTAATRAIGAAVTFYGAGLSTSRFGLKPLLEYASSLQTPWLGLYGELDKAIPLADVDAVKAAAAKAPVPTEVVVYEDADHGFHCNDRPAVYNPRAAAAGWARALDWFERHLSA